MKKNLLIYIFVITLIAVVSIAIGVVVLSYNKSKAVVPDISYIGNMSDSEMAKIKERYNDDGKKNEFLDLCKNIELVITNKLLDGSVTNEVELQKKINELNAILASSDWSNIEMDTPNYWIGKWSLDGKGLLHFSFDNKQIEPDWSKDELISKYIR